MEARAFPWRPALTGAALLLLALLTVSMRAQAVAEGRALLDAELQRASLHRRTRDLHLRIEQCWHELGRQDRTPPQDS